MSGHKRLAKKEIQPIFHCLGFLLKSQSCRNKLRCINEGVCYPFKKKNYETPSLINIDFFSSSESESAFVFY